MSKLIVMILLCSASLLMAGTYTVKSSAQLYKALQNREKDLIINLEAGEYNLVPVAVTDSTLGNAENPDSMITVTTGLHLVGKNIQLIGQDRRKTIIRTHAGYGIFIEHCPEVLIKNLTITDGTRDQDPNATSAAIVVKHSHTEITGCIIENNQGDFSKTIAGICGIVGREGARLNIHNNVIRDNSWDGIALYRKARADSITYESKVQGIIDNIIYNGRGAGIGITWDAEANIQYNVIHHYWKGIGSFGTSRVRVFSNLVRDIRGWGIIASGNSEMSCTFNEVHRIGNVGIAVWDSTVTMQPIVGNVIWKCGIEKQWVAPLVGIWINAPDRIGIYKNLFLENTQADIAFGYKEPGIDGSDFTFEYKTDKFNNHALHSIGFYKESNYYTHDLMARVYARQAFESDSRKFIDIHFHVPGDLMMHDSRGILVYGDWTWDPDKEPFQD